MQTEELHTLEEIFGPSVVAAARELVTRSREYLTFRHMFYGAEIFSTPCIMTARCRTMATDGELIYVNPAFTNKLNRNECVGVLVHELMHIVLLHPYRLSRIIDRFMDRYNMTKAKTHKLANYAMDYALNPLVVADGFKLPKGALLEPKYDGNSFEEIMHLMIENGEADKLDKKGNESSDGDGDDEGESSGGGGDEGEGAGGGGDEDVSGQDCGVGEVIPYPGDEDQTREAERSKKSSVRQILTAAKACGKEPGWTSKLLSDWDEAQVDWREELHSDVSAIIGPRKESSWERPNRRYIQMGVYLPYPKPKGIGEIVATVDVSGSVSDLEAHTGLSEIAAIVNTHQPDRSVLIQYDTEIKGDPIILQRGEAFPDQINRRGNGGTDFRPQFEWVRQEGIRPSVMICITDGHAPWPQKPSYPVIWLMTTNRVAPWGKTIHLRVGS